MAPNYGLTWTNCSLPTPDPTDNTVIKQDQRPGLEGAIRNGRGQDDYIYMYVLLDLPLVDPTPSNA